MCRKELAETRLISIEHIPPTGYASQIIFIDKDTVRKTNKNTSINEACASEHIDRTFGDIFTRE
jgi:hypothetical protein